MELLNTLSWFVIIMFLIGLFSLIVEFYKKGKSVINKNKKFLIYGIIIVSISIVVILLNNRLNEINNILSNSIPNDGVAHAYNIKYEYDDLYHTYRGSNYEVYINDRNIWLSKGSETIIHDLYKESTLDFKIHYPIYSDGSFFENELGSVRLSDLMGKPEEHCLSIDKYSENTIGFCFFIEREVDKREVWENIF